MQIRKVLLLLKLSNQRLCVFLVHVHLQSLDMLLVLPDTLSQSLHVATVHRGLPNTLALQVMATLSHCFELVLQSLELCQVLVLDFSELGLYNIEFLFVLEVSFAEAVGELLSLCVIQVFVVMAVLLLLG